MEKEFKVLISGRIGTAAAGKEPFIKVFYDVADALDYISNIRDEEGESWEAEIYDPMPEWEEFENAPPTAWEEALKLDVDGLCSLLLLAI